MSEEGKGVQRKTILVGKDFGGLLVRKGIVPPTTRRLIIDCRVSNEIVILYTEQFADEKLLDEELTRLLAGG